MKRPLPILAFLLLALGSTNVAAQAERSYLPLSLSYMFPGGSLDDSIDVQPGLGFAIGYQYAPDRHWRIGAKGTWMWSKLGVVDTADYSAYAATFYQILATVQWRAFKHGWSPYIQVEGGLGFMNLDEMIGNMPVKIPGASAVRGSVGALLGVLIPLSNQLDIDVSGRWNYSFIADGYTLTGVNAGVVYSLSR